MKEISVSEINYNFFDGFHKDWALVVVKDQKEDNAMTISWGGIGILWSKPVTTVYVRNTRYTKHMLDDSEYFSVCFFDEKYRDKLKYLGTQSRRNEDKITCSNLTRVYSDDVLYLKEAKLTLIMKKIYQVDLPLDQVQDKSILKFYQEGEMHTAYIGEVVKVLIED